MPIIGMTLKSGATAVTLTGGSDVIYKDDGADVQNGVHVVDTSVATVALRPHSTFKSKPATYTNGVAVKGKREITHVRPKTLSGGDINYPLFRISFELDPECSAAEMLELKMQAVQHIMDADLNDFFNYGTVRS